jgi:hypothetical protein
LLGPPQLQQFVDVATDSRVDLSLADGRGLHLGWLLLSPGDIAKASAFRIVFI